MNIKNIPNHEIPSSTYSFNILAGQLTTSLNKRFSFVEGTNERNPTVDSLGNTYVTASLVMTEDDKGAMDKSLVRVFLETLQSDIEGNGKHHRICWGEIPWAHHDYKRINGSDIKFYTLRAKYSIY